MIYVGNLDEVEDVLNGILCVDEIWYIVRSLKPYKQIPGVISKHVPELAPSLSLFLNKEKYRKQCLWNKKFFDEWFSSNYINEINQNKTALSLITQLKEMDKKGKSILLVCYCKREDICHRSVLKKIIKNI